MGTRAAGWWRRSGPRGLGPAKREIMWEAVWSCEDDTALLPFGIGWLMDKTEMGKRSLERHLPQLGKLDLLVPADGGFRLPRFFESDRQFGGVYRQIDRQSGRQIGGAYKEGFNGILGDSLDLALFESFRPDDDEGNIRELAKQHGIPEDLAQLAYYTGIARHFGTSGRKNAIRSLRFFDPVVGEFTREGSAQVAAASPWYVDYVRRKAREARELVNV